MLSTNSCKYIAIAGLKLKKILEYCGESRGQPWRSGTVCFVYEKHAICMYIMQVLTILLIALHVPLYIDGESLPTQQTSDQWSCKLSDAFSHCHLITSTWSDDLTDCAHNDGSLMMTMGAIHMDVNLISLMKIFDEIWRRDLITAWWQARYHKWTQA